MQSLDRRTKRRVDIREITVSALLEGGVDDERRLLAARAQDVLKLPPLTVVADGDTFSIDTGTFRPGEMKSSLKVELDPGMLTELVTGIRTTSGLLFQGGAAIANGSARVFLAWDHVLRALFDGVPLLEPGTFGFSDRSGTPLDLSRSFTPGDDDADIAHFLAETGFLHLRGWIDPELLDMIASEVDAAARAATPEQPHRWWARVEDGTSRCVRVMYVLEVAPTMADLVESPEYRRLGSLFGDGHRRFPERAQSSEALIKPVGVVEGISEFPWHRDCTMGGHDFGCAGYAIGLPLTATNDEAGQLCVVAGSHRASVPPPGLVDGYDSGLPVLALATEPGDLTVHVGCTLHMTKPPRSRERTVVYTTFALPPQPGDPEPSRDGAKVDPKRLAEANQN